MNRRAEYLNLKRALPALLFVLILLAAACSSSSDDSSAAPAPASRDSGGEEFQAFDAPAAEEPAEAAAPSAERANDLGAGGVALASVQPLNVGRDIIFRADLTVAVADVGSAGAEATTVVESLGGFLFGQQTTGQPNPRSILTFKILPDNFQAALAALGSIGELRSQNVSADDVTDRVVDLESRISTAEASVARLREFLDDANDIVTIAELERELLNRETTLETLRGQLRTVQDQVALATIILTLTEADISPEIDLFVSTYLGHDDTGASCPGEEEPSFLEGDDITVCFEIFNSGDTSLTGLTLRDTVLDVELDGLIVVFGSPDTLESGESLVLAVEVEVDRDLRTQTKVTAEPVNTETGEVIEGRTVSTTRSMFIDVRSPGGLPGFSDGISASWDVLQDIGGIGILVAGAVLPFVWLIVLIGAWLWLRRRNRDGEETS